MIAQTPVPRTIAQRPVPESSFIINARELLNQEGRNTASQSDLTKKLLLMKKQREEQLEKKTSNATTKKRSRREES